MSPSLIVPTDCVPCTEFSKVTAAHLIHDHSYPADDTRCANRGDSDEWSDHYQRDTRTQLDACNHTRRLQLPQPERGRNRVPGVHPHLLRQQPSREHPRAEDHPDGLGCVHQTHDTSTAAGLTSGQPGNVTVTYAPAATGQSDSATLTATLIQPGGHPGPTTIATASRTLLGGSLTPDGVSVMGTPDIAVIGAAGDIVGTAQATADFSGIVGGSAGTPVIEFTLYGPSATANCSGPPVYSGTGGQVLAGASDLGGMYATQSPALSQPGTYWWTASYSGNASNWPVSSACGDPGSSVVIPAVAPGKLYYTDGPSPNVLKANLDGSNPQPIPGHAWAVAVDSSRMYYATLQSSQIWAANLDGSNVQTIAATSPGLRWAEVRDMAVHSGIVYWTGSDGGGGSAMAMYQISIPAPAPQFPPATAQMLQAGGAYLAVGPQ
jgi:hypothetical protein